MFAKYSGGKICKLPHCGPSNRLYGRSGGVKWGRLYVVPLIKTLFFASLLCPFSTWGRKVEIVVFSLSLPRFPVYFFLSDKFKINIQVGKRWQLKIPNIFFKKTVHTKIASSILCLQLLHLSTIWMFSPILNIFLTNL